MLLRRSATCGGQSVEFVEWMLMENILSRVRHICVLNFLMETLLKYGKSAEKAKRESRKYLNFVCSFDFLGEG